MRTEIEGKTEQSQTYGDEYAKYPAYKDTNVEWVNEIPRDWKLSKVKYLFDEIATGTTPRKSNDEYFDGSIDWINSGDLNDGIVEESEESITKKALEEHTILKQFPSGTLIVAMYGATKGKVGILNDPATINQACCALLKPNDCVTKFVFYSLLSLRQELISVSYGGGQDNISQDVIRNFSIPAPPKSEQKAIVHFLDQETEKIDRLIEQKERLIELLEEKREALITRAVTKGLDPDAEMKDSGVEWLGSIPQNWEMVKLGYLSEFIVPQRDKPKEFDGEVPWIRIEDLEGKYVSNSKSDRGVSQKMIDEMNLRVFPEGTVLCSCSCDMGTSAIVKQPLISNQTFIGIVPGRRMDSEYLYYQMKVAKHHLNALSTGAIQQYLSRDDFSQFEVIVPPQKTQKTIAEYIDSKLERIDSFTEKIRESIDRMKEYRKAIISSAVTGKIDVREEFNAY